MRLESHATDLRNKEMDSKPKEKEVKKEVKEKPKETKPKEKTEPKFKILYGNFPVSFK